MSLNGIKLVTFDATNTLLKFRIPPWKQYTFVARRYGFEENDYFVKQRLEESYKYMWNKYPNFGRSQIKWEEWWTQVVKKTFHGHLPANADIDIIAKTLIDEFRTATCWTVPPAAHRLLNILKTQVLQIGVISNFDPRLNEILQSVNIFEYFDFIVTSYDVGVTKPDNKIFTQALQQCKIKVQPYEALHIGDDFQKDYYGAKAAGWHAVLVCDLNKNETPPAIENVFSNLKELSEAIVLNNLKF